MSLLRSADQSSATVTWKIENFPRLKTKKLYSEIFSVGGYKWRVLVFPKGNNVEHLSVYLDVADSATLPQGWSIEADYGFALINQISSKKTVRKDTRHVFTGSESDWGFTSFLPLRELNDPVGGFLVNGTIVVDAVVAVLDSQGSTKENGENGSPKEESELSSEDNSSGNVEANITEMSPPQPPLQPTSDTLIPSVHAPHPGSSDATPPAGKVRFLSYWVSAEASRFLERVHSSHNDTFSKFSMKGQALQTVLLESLASFIESMSTTMVNTVDEEAMRLASVSIEDFEQVGLDLSWLKQRLDETKRVNRYLETVTSNESKESALEVARAKVRELEEGLAKAKAELEAMWEGLPKSLGGHDYVLKDVV